MPRTGVKNVRSPERIDLYGIYLLARSQKRYLKNSSFATSRQSTRTAARLRRKYDIWWFLMKFIKIFRLWLNLDKLHAIRAYLFKDLSE